MTADPLIDSRYHFDLPEELIALRPAEPKDAARLLVVRASGVMHAHVRDLPDFLQAGDTLVFNETRVLPAALKGVRPARDADGRDVTVDVNLIAQRGAGTWRALARPGRRLKTGDTIIFDEDFHAEMTGEAGDGAIDLCFNLSGEALRDRLHAVGQMPLPPYIARRRAADAQDRCDYQTRFATGEAVSVAAPTAGLHFTDKLLDRLERAEVEQARVRLDVGAGTFAPLKDEQVRTGRLHSERCRMDTATAATLNRAKTEGRRIIPVGTTSLRTLETVWRKHGHFEPFEGETDIFIRPPDSVGSADALLTNFHLPGSSLFLLVCAVMGTETMQAAYAEAIAQRYRFFSYGDACLLLPHG